MPKTINEIQTSLNMYTDYQLQMLLYNYIPLKGEKWKKCVFNYRKQWKQSYRGVMHLGEHLFLDVRSNIIFLQHSLYKYLTFKTT